MSGIDAGIKTPLVGVPEELNLGTGKPKSYCHVPSKQLVFQQGLFPGQQAKF